MKLLNCEQAAGLFHDSEQQLFDCCVVSSSTTFLPSLEKLLLDLTAYGCVDGIFYCLALQLSDHIVVRFHEAGCFQGMMKSKYLSHMSTTTGSSTSQFLMMQLYTSEDVTERIDSLKDRRRSIVSARHTGQYMQNS